MTNKLNAKFMEKAIARETSKGKHEPFTKALFNACNESDYDWNEYQLTILQALNASNNNGNVRLALVPLFKALGLNTSDNDDNDDNTIIKAIVETPIATTRNGYIMTDETKATRAKAREIAKATGKEFSDVYTSVNEYEKSVVQVLSVDSYRKALESVIAMVLNNQSEYITNANNARNAKITKALESNIAKYESKYNAIVTEQPTLAREFDHKDYQTLKDNVKEMYTELLAIREKANKETNEQRKNETKQNKKVTKASK